MSIKMNIEYALTHFLILIDGHKRRNHFRKGDRRPIMYWDKGWNVRLGSCFGGTREVLWFL